MELGTAEIRLQSGQGTEATARLALVDVLARAFLDNPMNRRLHRGNEAARLRANRAGLKSLVLDSASQAKTWTIEGDGQVLGGLVATLPGSGAPMTPRIRRQVEALWLQGPKALQGWGRLNQELEGIRPAFPVGTISVLGIDPASWRQGLASRLLDTALSDPDFIDRPFYLESDREESVSFYRARGFEEYGRVRFFGIDCVGLIHDRT